MKFHHWSTGRNHVSERTALWSEANGRYFGRLQVVSLDDGPLDASMEAYEVGALRMFRLEVPAHRVSRDANCGALPSDDFYKLVLQVKGQGSVEQAGQRVQIQPGGWVLYDPRSDYSITTHVRSTLLVTQVPRQLLGALAPGPLSAESGSGNTPGLHALFGAYLRSLSDQLPQLSDDVGDAVCESVMGLLGSALAERRQRHGDPIPLPAVMRLRVRQYLQAHLSDPDLSISKIAEAMRCSTRYLHRVFEHEGVSLERLIWTLRLERCRAALQHELNTGRSAAEIAFAWGFKSNAHFGRLFKDHFGMTPGAAQRQAMSERRRATTQ